MLPMPALQLRHPMPFVILLKADDRTPHPAHSCIIQ
jgi:hypothetical protein